MDRPSIAAGPKVSQIANLFQRRPSESDADGDRDGTTVSQVTRSESHTTRFHNARALFEKLGVESPAPRPAALSLRMSNSSSREDNLCGADEADDGNRTPSPKRKHAGSNGMAAKRDPTKIHNTSRNKIEKPEKPEKPERKFNSKELIEKQKNWTSHFTKTRPTRFNSDPNRCDIIRAVPSAVHYPGHDAPPGPAVAAPIAPMQAVPPQAPVPIPPAAISAPIPVPAAVQRSNSHSRSMDGPPKIPPSPPVRHVSLTSASTNFNVPDVKPRLTSKANSVAASPAQPPLPPVPVTRPLPNSPVKIEPAAKPIDVQPKRKRSIELVDSDIASPPVEYAQVKKHFVDLVTSSTSPAPSASSPQSSPSHTEDEKQEIESNEKTDLYDEIIMECKYIMYIYLFNSSTFSVDHRAAHAHIFGGRTPFLAWILLK